MSDPALLEVRDLRVHYTLAGGGRSGPRERLEALAGVDLDVGAGETVGLVGESGSGKSTLCRAVLRLVEPSAGSVRFDGDELTALSRRRLRAVRGRIQMVFQDPMSSLNPRRRVADTIATSLRLGGARGAELERQTGELLARVGLGDEHRRRYPHELSGGQRQRVGIARALATRPRLILADEPVSALDVSVRAQIVNLMRDLQDELGLGYLFVAHDIGIVRQIADRIAVMKAGEIVESGPTDEVCDRPRHPYTRELLASVPIADPARARARRENREAP